MIQADIDQSVKWKPSYQRKTLETYFRLSSQAALLKPTLIVWPETALPFFYQDAPAFSSQMRYFADRIGATLLFGSPAYERKSSQIQYYNRAYMLTPGSSQVGYYDKRHLVPFGEYVPLKRYLPFLNQLVQAAGNFVSGDRQGPLKKKDISLGVLICFEAIFPELARDLARDGAQVLVNITNDAWFGTTSAPYQHLSMAVFRSVETGASHDTGRQHRIQRLYRPEREDSIQKFLFEEAVLVQSVPFSPSAPDNPVRPRGRPVCGRSFGDFPLETADRLSNAHETEGIMNPEQQNGRSVPPGRVFVIDDEPLTLKNLRRILEKDGHSVSTFTNPFRAPQTP